MTAGGQRRDPIGQFTGVLRNESCVELDASAGDGDRDRRSDDLRVEVESVRRIAVLIADDFPDARFLTVVTAPDGEWLGVAAIHAADGGELAHDIAVDGFGAEDFESVNASIDRELNNLNPFRESGGWRDFEVQWTQPSVLAIDLVAARSGVGVDGRLVDFPTDTASAAALIEQIPADRFVSGADYCRGAVEGRQWLRQAIERNDDDAAAIAAMDAWTSHRSTSGHRDEALDDIAAFRRTI